jgi:hypothetical protein
VIAMTMGLVLSMLQPAVAEPCPWGTTCMDTTLITPTTGDVLRGTVALEAEAVVTRPERGEVVLVEWWLIHEDFARQNPANAEAKVLLDETTVPTTGDNLDGVYTGSWTVSDTLTARDGDWTSSEILTYTLPQDGSAFRVEAHILDQAWLDDDPNPGPPPGLTAPAVVTIDFGTGGGDGPIVVDPIVDRPDPDPVAVEIGGLALPTSVELTPAGRVYISEKGGAIKMAESLASTSASTVATVDTYDEFDHGLQSLAYHPNGYLYAAYTSPPEGPCEPGDFGQEGAVGCVVHGQLSRFLVNSDGSLGAEESVRGGAGNWCAQFQTHGIDDIEIGADGNLYISAGDGAGYSIADTGQFAGDPCGDGGALRAQSPSNFMGNVVRMSPTGGSVETIAYGLRNPYRISFQTGTNNLFIGDVGWFVAEEINRVDVSGSAPNFGWPCREGTSATPFYDEVAACDGVTGQAPLFSYTHNGDNAAISALGYHDGRVYYGDYHRGFIRSVAPDGTGDRSEISGSVLPVDMLSTSVGLIYVDIAGAVRSLDGTTPPPSDAANPYIEVVVSEQPWTPGQEIDYAVDFRNFGRVPITIEWTITRGDGSVVARATANPDGPDGRQRGRVTAPADATYPETLTFQVTVSNTRGDTETKSANRAMAVPPTSGGGGSGGGGGSDGPGGTGGGEPTPSSPLSDITTNTHREAILRMVEAGVILGRPDGTYGPGLSVTRGQVASLIYRAGEYPDRETSPFSDVAGTTHAPAIRALVAAGVLNGFSDGTFRPGAFISREQMASILQRAFDLEDGDPSQFTDVNPNGTHAPGIGALVAAGITRGTTATTFAPSEDVKRDQMASFIDRALSR